MYISINTYTDDLPCCLLTRKNLGKLAGASYNIIKITKMVFVSRAGVLR